MSSDSTPYAFNPLNGDQEDAIKHLKAIRQKYEAAHGPLSHGKGFQAPIENLVSMFRGSDKQLRDVEHIRPDFGYKYAELTHHGNELTIIFTTTTPDESKVQHVDPDSYIADENEAQLSLDTAA